MPISIYIHEQRYKRVPFFKGKSTAFITWICPLLKPIYFPSHQYIYLEGDEIENIYFLVKGQASFVLPKYENTKYINIEIGDLFGLIDLIGSCQIQSFDLLDWISKKN